jgi:hypothetical protein
MLAAFRWPADNKAGPGLRACNPVKDGAGPLPQEIQAQASAACSSEMRRTSSIVYGFDCVE